MVLDEAMESMEGERSRAFIFAILREVERILRVLRPVPHPSSVIVMAVDSGFSDERVVKAWVRRDGSSWSSIAWRMLPSVS